MVRKPCCHLFILSVHSAFVVHVVFLLHCLSVRYFSEFHFMPIFRHGRALFSFFSMNFDFNYYFVLNILDEVEQPLLFPTSNFFWFLCVPHWSLS
jgi:hypothetical protein